MHTGTVQSDRNCAPVPRRQSIVPPIARPTTTRTRTSAVFIPGNFREKSARNYSSLSFQEPRSYRRLRLIEEMTPHHPRAVSSRRTCCSSSRALLAVHSLVRPFLPPLSLSLSCPSLTFGRESDDATRMSKNHVPSHRCHRSVRPRNGLRLESVEAAKRERLMRD